MDSSQIPFLENAVLTCSDVEELMDCYIDGEMIAVLKLRFENHLSNCEECRHLVEDTQHIVELASTLTDEHIPAGVSLRLRKALNEEVGHDVVRMKPHLSLVKS